jgi:hypothetical protein
VQERKQSADKGQNVRRRINRNDTQGSIGKK